MGAQMRGVDNVLRTVRGIRMRDGGGTVRTIQTGKIRDAGGALKTFFVPMAATMNPAVINQNDARHSQPYTLTTSPTGMGVTGGIPPITYAWAWQSGGAGITINQYALPDAPNVANFVASLMYNDTKTGVAKCTATDAWGMQVSATVDVSIHLTQAS